MCTVNHELKAMFIHIPKTGGLYVEETLIKYYGFTRYYGIKLNNYGFLNHTTTPSLPMCNRGALRYCINNEHLFQTTLMDEGKWKGYFIFTFVRNPYSRIVSGYEYVKTMYVNETHNTDNKALLSYHYYHTLIQQHEHVLDNNDDIKVDYVGRFEHLNIDLVTILQRIGVSNYFAHMENITKDVKLNQVDKKQILDYYDDDILQFVNDYFLQDFCRFNYIQYQSLDDLNKHICFSDDLQRFKEDNQKLVNENALE